MITSRINLDQQHSVVLHSYHYQNSSLIVNFFLKNHGKVSAIAKGVNTKKSGGNHSVLLQPFQSTIVSLTGKQELLILKNIEATDIHWQLSGKALYCAYYINELLLRLLPSYSDCSDIFILYNKVMTILASGLEYFEAPLRFFELKLLEFLGYGLNLEFDCESDASINRDKNYYYVLYSGASENKPMASQYLVISGQSLLDLAHNQLSNPQSLQQSKQLLKWALAEHLGHQPLKSREIFKQLYS